MCCAYFPSLRAEGAGAPMSSHRGCGSSGAHDSYMWYVCDRPRGECGLHLLRGKGFEGGSLALIQAERGGGGPGNGAVKPSGFAAGATGS